MVVVVIYNLAKLPGPQTEYRGSIPFKNTGAQVSSSYWASLNWTQNSF